MRVGLALGWPWLCAAAGSGTLDVVILLGWLRLGLNIDVRQNGRAGLDIGNVLFEQASTAHTGLFHSVGGTAFTAPNTTLFEAVRVTGHGGEWLKALFHVATMPPCCRGPDGDANTPYNRTCGKTTMAPLWLQPGPGKPAPPAPAFTLVLKCLPVGLFTHLDLHLGAWATALGRTVDSGARLFDWGTTTWLAMADYWGVRIFE